ncbi:uncharacterized protein F4807DRAFT_431817 [Annulohypoxylon truncatum]|uniref:uncharacterized protein n=1 Tax=Annulohypoxylon truncatum TaxID=327061 RepID=UPI0020084B42|nr:uncharacterized protein F4807DRAFT_431817 [Annulohypoxylon truncatum]KAI1208160.1 hypothetical protein F4807DRAFT_431817 [Annulohypoxylon truncatum]
MASEGADFDPSLVDENRGRMMLITDTVFTVLIVLSTGTRIANRLRNKRAQFGIENYLILLALVLNLTTNALEYVSVQEGFGRHLQFLTDEQKENVKRISEYTILFAVIDIWAVKISICFFILSLIRDSYRRSKWVIYGLMALTTIASFVQGMIWGLQARPLERLWKPGIPGTTASPKTLVVMIITCTALFSFTDIFYALSPIYFFGRLQMELRKKLIILGLTGSGLSVFAASIVRVAFVKEFLDPDFTWALPRVYVCTIIERNLAQLVADLPANYPLFRHIHGKVTGFMKYGSSRSKMHTGTGDNHTIDPCNDSQRAIVTIGSAETRPRQAIKLNDLSVYGKSGQLTHLEEGGSDEYI